MKSLVCDFAEVVTHSSEFTLTGTFEDTDFNNLDPRCGNPDSPIMNMTLFMKIVVSCLASFSPFCGDQIHRITYMAQNYLESCTVVEFRKKFDFEVHFLAPNTIGYIFEIQICYGLSEVNGKLSFCTQVLIMVHITQNISFAKDDHPNDLHN